MRTCSPRSLSALALLQPTITERWCSMLNYSPRSPNALAQLRSTINHRTPLLYWGPWSITERSCSSAAHGHRTLLLYCSSRSPNALAELQLTVTEHSRYRVTAAFCPCILNAGAVLAFDVRFMSFEVIQVTHFSMKNTGKKCFIGFAFICYIPNIFVLFSFHRNKNRTQTNAEIKFDTKSESKFHLT